MTVDRPGIFQGGLQLFEATRDPTGDCACRQAQFLTDRAVGLVAGEEAVEAVAAGLGEEAESELDVERALDLSQAVRSGVLHLRHGRLAGGAEPVDARA